MSSWVKYMHIYICCSVHQRRDQQSTKCHVRGLDITITQCVIWRRYSLFLASCVDRVQRLLSLQGSLHKALLKPEKVFQETFFLVENWRTNPEPPMNEFLAILTEIKISRCKQVKVPHSLLKTKDLHSLDLISARNWMTHYSSEILQSYCCDTGSQNGFLLILYWLPLTNPCCGQFFMGRYFQNTISTWESVWRCQTIRKNCMIISPCILWS